MAKRYLSNQDISIPLFENKLLDKFTYVHPAVPVVLYAPVIAFLVYQALTATAMTGLEVAGLAILGILAWTLTEYLGHRYAFHFDAKTDFGKYVSHLIHGVHHDYPNDSRRLVMPPVVSVPLAFIFFGLFWLLLGQTLVLALFPGFLAGYIAYDMVHYAIHHFSMKSRIGQILKHHHIRHHYKDEELGFGVSSPIWDHVFGTKFLEK